MLKLPMPVWLRVRLKENKKEKNTETKIFRNEKYLEKIVRIHDIGIIGDGSRDISCERRAFL